MRSTIHILGAAALGAVLLLSAPVTNAQAPSGSPAPSGQAANIPDQKLDAAAAAIGRVATLSRDYQQQIAAAQPGDRQRIADEANKALEKAVTDQGLTVREYNSIIETAQNNPEVHQKIVQRLQPQAK